jgi:5-methylcytosine-specific restriction endonuclease McrA
MRTLLLMPWMTPHKIVSWQRAVVLVVLGTAEIIEEYDVALGRVDFKTPSVVRLTKGHPMQKQSVRFSRMNVFTRDGFRCQYCGVKKDMRELNYDHVVPRVRGGKTVWENIVTSCYVCNDRKGSRTPDQAGMKLLRKPFKPTSLPLAPVIRTGKDVPSSWRSYCTFPGDGDRTRVA